MESTNHRYLRALARQPVDVTPVWMMRQAGRYLPEYRATREQAGSFLTLCKTPELACEVTLQPLRRFPLDAAIVFSDILTVPDAMGLGLYFVEGEGPRFRNPARDAAAIEALAVPDPESELRYVTDTLRLLRRELDGKVPLIGFAGSPWTLATYMVEGGASKEYALVKGMMYRRPELLRRLLEVTARALVVYLQAQVAAGAQALMIFDTWGGILTAPCFEQFSLSYMRQIVTALRADEACREVPVTLFTKGGGQWLEAMVESGCDALGLDWTVNIGEARRRVGEKVALQGNLDPCVLYAEPAQIRAAVADTLRQFGHGPGHVFNLGHGIHQHVDPENALAMIEAVHDLSGPYHESDRAGD